MRRVGVLLPFPENDPLSQAVVTEFAQALGRLGWNFGGNIQIDYRFAAGDPALFKTYAAELIGLSPDAILASTPQVVAAFRQQMHTIPIVFVLVIDPVGLGFVQSIARPGGSITGFSAYDPPVMGKWLQLLKEVAPKVTRVAVIFNPNTTAYTLFNAAIEAAAPSFGMTVRLTPVHDDTAIEDAIAAEASEPGGGLICLPDSFIVTHRNVIIAAAARHGLPLFGSSEVFPRSGALMSYFFDIVGLYAQDASYIDTENRDAGKNAYPAGTSTSTNVRLTEAEIHAVSMACRAAVGIPQIKIVCQQIWGHSVRVLLDPAARLEPGARLVNS
jgi:putative ABC transport system substrate-binding protein